MALDSPHPKYIEMLPDWEKMRDVYKGERHVKEQGTKYLPVTENMILDGFGKATLGTTVNVGANAYNAYRMRAVVPDYMQEAVEVLMGLLHSQPPKIELPDGMEPLREKATQLGESLEQLLQRINEEQLVTGRLGLLLDLPEKPDPAVPMPYIALYIAEAGINWDDGEIEEGPTKLNLVVLDESGYRRQRGNFDWDLVRKFRVLELTPVLDDDNNVVNWGPYRQGVFTAEGGGTPDYVESSMKNPVFRGKTLDEVPFVFVNTKDIVTTPDKPSLLGLVNAVLTIYRGEADYRQNLFMQGQDTLLIVGDMKRAADPNELAATGDNSPIRTGAGSAIVMETGGSAEYIGVNSEGLSEQREALVNDRTRAEAKAGALSNNTANQAESGEALKTRVGARTASLNSIAVTGAGALEWLLKVAAKWMGQNPDKVKVTPNMEFADYQMTGDMLVKLMTAKGSGAPLSRESIHALMAEGGVTKYSYDEEKALLDKEAAEAPPPGTGAGGDPNKDPQQQQNRNQPPVGGRQPVKK